MNKNDIAPLTEEEKASWPKEPKVALEKPFVDARGAIQPLVDEMIKSAVMITSKKGSLRANHYHKTDWHYCYVISGCIEYYHRPTGSTEEPERLLIKAGEMVFTPPMVDHGMTFPEDNLVQRGYLKANQENGKLHRWPRRTRRNSSPEPLRLSMSQCRRSCSSLP